MRISSQQLLNSSIRAIQDQSVEAMKWQDQISSGKRYNAASQGMVALARGVEIAFDQSKFKMLKANQDFVATRMAMADSQLGSMIDAMGVIKEASDQAVNGSLGPAGFSALAAKARTAYDALAQMAVATNANDERILLTAGTPARLSPPKTVVVSPLGTTTSAEISDAAVFEVGGTYSIRFAQVGEGVRPLLQVGGVGPDGTSASYYEGTLNGISVHFPQQEGVFFNLDLQLEGYPSTDDPSTTITFEANPVQVALNYTSRVHDAGVYTVELSKSDQFDNWDFEGLNALAVVPGLTSLAGWNVTPQGDDVVSLSPDTPTGFGNSLRIATEFGGGAELVSQRTVNMRAGDEISFDWGVETDDEFEATISIRNTTTDDVQVLHLVSEDGAVTPVELSWNRTSALVAEDGQFKFEVSTTGQGNFYLDNLIVTHQEGEYSSNVTRATLYKDDEVLDVITDTDGIAYDSSTKITTLNFGDSAADPAGYYNLGYTIVGDPTNMRSTDRISVTVGSSLKQIEIEPGVWVDEGISFRDALGQGQGSSRDVLAAALAVVQRLEAAAQTGVLADGFGTSVENLKSSTDQLVKYQVRAGLIGNRVDAAKDALEVKATELEAHRSRLLDTDIAEASAGLVRTQTLLEAARSIFARLESSNLFQRLM